MPARAIVLDSSELEFLKGVLDWWIEGLPESIANTETDNVFDIPEEMLAVINDLRNQGANAETIRSKVLRAMGVAV